MKKISLLLSILLLSSAANSYAGQGPVRRIGMFVGANDGGRQRVTLRWAASDAQKMAQVMQELGSIQASDIYYLSDPTITEIAATFENVINRITSARENARRVEFIFYYSGHSDDLGILVGEDRLYYSSLRRMIQAPNADVTVAIIDGCESGAFTRTKGGDRIQAFLSDESTDMKGFAFLSSSSDSEASQESDRIQASFFTHFVLSGLRGAADTSQDGRVTLNELYQYAFRETLAMTASTVAGPQHPSYDIQLSGTGDVVLTDVTTPDSSIDFNQDVDGRILIQSQNGNILSEFSKSSGSRRIVAVPPDEYTITVTKSNSAMQTTVTAPRNGSALVSSVSMQRIEREQTRLRGSFSPDSVEDIGVEIGIFPPLSWRIFDQPSTRNRTHLSVSVLAGSSEDVHGFAHSGIFQNTTGNAYGLQTAGIASIIHGNQHGLAVGGVYQESKGNSIGISAGGIYNLVKGRSSGLQVSGLYAESSHIVGLQTAPFTRSEQVTGAQIGLLNQAGTVYGLQIGLINIADDVYGIPVGLINYVKNGINDVTVWLSNGDLTSIGFRNGTRNIYSLFFIGFGREDSWQDFNHLIAGAGVGARINLPGPFHIDTDISVARAAVGDDLDTRISSMISPGEAAILPVMRLTGGINFGRFGLYTGAAIYGEPQNMIHHAGRYWHVDDPLALTTMWGSIGLHPQLITGFTF